MGEVIQFPRDRWQDDDLLNKSYCDCDMCDDDDPLQLENYRRLLEILGKDIIYDPSS